MYRVVISPSANADLFNALSYITHELANPQAAAKLADGMSAMWARRRLLTLRRVRCLQESLMATTK